MAELSREELRRLARLGAHRRIEELRREEAAIRAAFPDLEGVSTAPRRKRGRRAGRAAKAAASKAAPPARAAKGGVSKAAPPAKRAARYKMSAAQKRAVSERMKKYWAARRKAEG